MYANMFVLLVAGFGGNQPDWQKAEVSEVKVKIRISLDRKMFS